MADSTRGKLLVATPPLADPNFDRTVILMLEHNVDGALGLVLNRPGDTEVGAAFPDWSDQIAWPALLFTGGPVQPDALIALGRRSGEAMEGFAPLVGAVGSIDLAQSPATIPAVTSVRVFAGYAGWTADQLDGELESKAWLVIDADDADPFTAHPEYLWRGVLARQPGRTGWLANFPDDLLAN